VYLSDVCSCRHTSTPVKSSIYLIAGKWTMKINKLCFFL
jgi:hypothetical protein